MLTSNEYSVTVLFNVLGLSENENTYSNNSSIIYIDIIKIKTEFVKGVKSPKTKHKIVEYTLINNYIYFLFRQLDLLLIILKYFLLTTIVNINKKFVFH